MRFSNHRILRDQSEHLAPRLSHTTFVARPSSYAQGGASVLASRRQQGEARDTRVSLSSLTFNSKLITQPSSFQKTALFPLKYMAFSDAADMAIFLITYIFAALWRHLISKWH